MQLKLNEMKNKDDVEKAKVKETIMEQRVNKKLYNDNKEFYYHF